MHTENVLIGGLVAVLAACSASSSSGGSSSSSSGASSSSGSSSGSTSSGSSGEAHFSLPTVAGACVSPQKTAGATFPTADQVLSHPALTWTGQVAGVVYGATDDVTSDPVAWTVYLQRLSAAGQTEGDAIMLGTGTSGQYGLLVPSVAANGSRFLACWQNGTQVHCQSADAATGQTGTPQSFDGSSPSVVFGPHGYLLAFLQGGTVHLGLVDAQGAGTTAAINGLGGTAVAVTASSRRYVVAGGSSSGLDIQLLTESATAEGAPIHLGTPRITAPLSLVDLDGDRVAYAWARNSDVFVQTVDTAGATSAAVQLNTGGDTSYGKHALTRAASGFAASWSSFSGSVQYVPFDSAGVATAASAPAVDTLWDDNANAIAAVSDGFLTVASTNPSNHPFVVTHLACP